LKSCALLSLVLLVACSGEGPPDVPAGHDTEISPDVLAGEEAKSDGDPCAAHGEGDVDGGALLVLVNKASGGQLRADYVPVDLLPLHPANVMPGRGALLRAGAAAALERLASDALEEGFDLRVRSAYRGFREQCFTLNYWVEQKGAEHADRFSARPGRSQHQLGTTVDLTAESWGWVLEPEVAFTAEAAWLVGNAHRFGFALSYPDGAEAVTGYGFEPWHYRYIGVDAAAEMAAEGILLETYLRRCRDDESTLDCPEEVAPEVPVNHRFIGGACAADDDCASLGDDARCLLEGHPGGHCTRPCERGCPDRPGNNALTFCAAEAGAGLCRSQCDFDRFSDSGCREGYACAPGERPDASRRADVCRPE